MSSSCLQLKVRESEENIVEHKSFHEHLLSLEKWVVVMRQKLESFLSPTRGWSLEGCQHEVQVCVSVCLCVRDHSPN